MKMEVKRLPKFARFDYRDAFGNKVYHTARKRYEVKTTTEFGKRVIRIYSETI